MASRRIEFEIAENPPKRFDKAIARDVPEEATLSRTRLARLIEEGGVVVDGAVLRDPKARVACETMMLKNINNIKSECLTICRIIPIDIFDYFFYFPS